MNTYIKKLAVGIVCTTLLLAMTAAFANEPGSCPAELNSRLAFLNKVHDIGLSERPNMVFSPASVDGLFALVGPGYHPSIQQTLTSYFGGVELSEVAQRMATLSQVTEGIKVTSAMGLFVDGAFESSLNPQYLDYVTKLYGFTPKVLDFANAKNTADEVNSWAADNTRNAEGIPLIDQIITPDFVTPAMQLILANALYFKGAWDSKFNARLTTEKAFTTSSGDTQQRVPTMHKYHEKILMQYLPQDGELGEYGDRGVVSVELPFAGKKFSFFAAMSAERAFVPAPPEQIQSQPSVTTFQYSSHRTAKTVLDQFIATGILTSPGRKTFTATELTRFAIPKFDIKSELSDLQDALALAGLSDLLAPGALSEMSSDRRLQLAKMIQKAVFKIDEEGGEGAAVTSVGFESTSIRMLPPPEIHLLLNGEFAFAVVNNETGEVLFQGVVGDPLQQ